MARKRGGLAGLYDRNKGLIRTAATIGGSLLGGPAAGAAIGAAFRGLDREGKSGIGFDIGQGLRGAAEGYATGKLTGAAKSSIGKMLAPKLPSVMAPDAIGMTNTMLGGGAGAGAGAGGGIAGGMGAIGNAASAPDVGSLAGKTAGAAGRGAGGGGGGGAGRLSRVAGFVERNPKTIEMATKGLTSQLPDPQAQRQLDIQQGNLDLLRQRQSLEEEEFRGRQRAGQATREMLMPLYQQLLAGRGQTGSMPGSPRSNMASPPSSFLAGSGPGSMNEYLDLTAMGPGNRSMMPGTMRPGTGMGDYLESTGAFVGRQELPDMAAGERFGMAGTMPRRQSPSMTRRSPGGFMILDDTSRGY